MIKIMSQFTHPQVVSNLYEFLSFLLQECKLPNSWWNHLTSTVEGNGAHQMFGYPCYLKYLLLCSAKERKSYRFGTTWGWV